MNRRNHLKISPWLRLLGTFAASALIIAACSESDAPDNAPAPTDTVSSQQASGTSKPKARAGTSCIASYAAKPCELLTEAIVRRHVTVTAEEIEQEDIGAHMESIGMSTNIGGMSMNGCTYSWDGGRTIDRSGTLKLKDDGGNPAQAQINAAMAQMMSNLPFPDTVGFRSIQELTEDDPLARFEQKWRTPTDDEREMMAQRMSEAMDKARDEGKLNDTGAELGKGLGKSIAGMSVEFEPVDGIATAARWGGAGETRSLHVLDGATEFEVAVNISDDDAINHETAIAVAKELLAECGG